MMFVSRQFKKQKLFLISSIVILLIAAGGFLGYKILSENELVRFNVITQNLNCTSTGEITNYLKARELNYFYFKSETLEGELRKKFFCIGQIKSEISYPDKLKLNITGREGKFIVTSIFPVIETNPAVQLSLEQMNATQSTTEAFPPKVLSQILTAYKNASGSAMYLTDEEGVVFEEVTTNIGFPRLSIFSQDLKIGQKIPGGYIKKIIQVLEKSNVFETTSDNLLIVGDRLIIDSKPRITFSLSKDVNRQSASLQLILRQAKMNLDPDGRDSRSIESIDLRFDRPVVVYSRK